MIASEVRGDLIEPNQINVDLEKVRLNFFPLTDRNTIDLKFKSFFLSPLGVRCVIAIENTFCGKVLKFKSFLLLSLGIQCAVANEHTFCGKVAQKL